MRRKSRAKYNPNIGIETHVHRVSLVPYLITPGTSVGLWVATAAAHQAWVPEHAGVAGVGLTLAGGGLTWLTHRATKPRGQVMRTVATCCAAAASSWTIGATLAAPWSRPWLDLWAGGAAVASAAVAVVLLSRAARGDGEQTERTGDALIDSVSALKDARIGAAKVLGPKIRAQITMPRGQTIGEVDLPAVESALDVRPGAARMLPSPDSARRGTLEVVPVDQLRDPAPWPGLSAPGRSISEPIELGVVEDGEPLVIWFPGDHRGGRNAAHYLVTGMSGAGKTELLLTIAAEVISRSDSELWFGDARKGAQLPEWLKRGAARVAGDEDQVDAMLSQLLADVSTRAAWLGERGHKQWVVGCGLPYRVAILDEASAVAAGNSIVVDLTESCRSVGISLIFGIQRAHHTRFPTSARSNIGGSLVLGVKDETDADMAMSEATIAAGAKPWLWKAAKPGMLYAEVPGVDESRWVLPARTYLVDERDRADAVAPYITEQASVPERTSVGRKDSVWTDDPATGWLDELVDQDAPDDVDPSQPFEPDYEGGFAFPAPEPSPPMSPERARNELVGYLHDLADAGTEEISPSDISAHVCEVTGRGGKWVTKMISELCSGAAPMLRRTERGRYRILVAELV